MASLFKNNGTWYLSLTHAGTRKTCSLKTKDHRVALKLKPLVEYRLITELMGLGNQCKELSFAELVPLFLKANHPWSKATYGMNKNILESHLSGKPLPSNPSSRAAHIRHINQCWSWGLKNNLISKAHKLPGDTKTEARHRTYTKDELNRMFQNIQDNDFNKFVQFAYYTGARSGEIRTLTRDQVLEDSLVVRGKTGQRIVKLNSQAKDIIHNQCELWNYRKDFLSHKFKKEARRLGIRNARFHDVRRTFGLNLIKQGMSIYKVSKLLGHKSVRTTEQHYAPLLTVEIEDFIL